MGGLGLGWGLKLELGHLWLLLGAGMGKFDEMGAPGEHKLAQSETKLVTYLVT